MPDNDNRWHLDRRVPIALVVALLAQTGGFVWWAATLTIRVEQLEQSSAGISARADRLTRVETHVENIGATMRRMELKFDRWTRGGSQ